MVLAPKSDKEGLRGIEEWAFYTQPFGPLSTGGARSTVTVGANLIRGRVSALGNFRTGHPRVHSGLDVPTTEGRGGSDENHRRLHGRLRRARRRITIVGTAEPVGSQRCLPRAFHQGGSGPGGGARQGADGPRQVLTDAGTLRRAAAPGRGRLGLRRDSAHGAEGRSERGDAGSVGRDRNLRAWHDDTFVSGPSWAEFTKQMGIGGPTGAAAQVYVFGVHRTVAGHREQLEKALNAPGPRARSRRAPCSSSTSKAATGRSRRSLATTRGRTSAAIARRHCRLPRGQAGGATSVTIPRSIATRSRIAFIRPSSRSSPWHQRAGSTPPVASYPQGVSACGG